MNPYVLLAKKRQGSELTEDEIREVARGAATGSWSEAQLGAFLMAVAIQGLSRRETAVLTEEMRVSGELWYLRDAFPGVVDKHSTGGVGDTVSLALGPLLACCGIPTVMLTGRSLGHTGGTADKLESIPSLDLALTRERTLSLLESVGLAVGIATEGIAPADRTLYRLRDQTATVSSIPLVIGSILSKKLAVGPAAIAFDVKTGSGAVFADPKESRELAQRLVDTSQDMGCPATALLTDMSQPLGSWVGHLVEVRGALEILENEGEPRLRRVTLALAEEAAAARPELGLSAVDFEAALADGRARQRFDEWAIAQGADASWIAAPDLQEAGFETVLEASRDGCLRAIDTQYLGQRMTELWRGAEGIDVRVGLRQEISLGSSVPQGTALARVFTARELSAEEKQALAGCFSVGETCPAPELIQARLSPSS
ncbi:MAG: thymidine phosphorylase [Acidobacteriota bacterium]